MTDTDVWTPPATHELNTPDGRTIRYCLYGPADGTPVIANHGTPGTRLLAQPWIDVIERCGVRLLTLDRAGYGGSTRRRDRSVADVASDVALLADAEGWDRFAVEGGSGGGPHALACAALLPARVTRCAVYVGVAPYATAGDGQGLAHDHWFEGMSPGNIKEFTAAMRGEAAYRPLVEQLGADAIASVERGEPAMVDGYDMPESDIAELRRRLATPSAGRLERAKASFLESHDGWIDDAFAFTRPWGFDIGSIRVPVSIWHGPDDVLVPRGHADWLIANVPAATAHELPGGHMLAPETYEEILRSLTA
jgi:pimeloyl-ACP methyl ester carboxylesterase